MRNAEKLKHLMIIHSLKSKDVAELISVSIDAVRSWLVHEGAAKHRPMKNRDIDYLKLKIKNEATNKKQEKDNGNKH